MQFWQTERILKRGHRSTANQDAENIAALKKKKKGNFNKKNPSHSKTTKDELLYSEETLYYFIPALFFVEFVSVALTMQNTK